ncbi:MAG TPA: hypothetical protein VN414_06030 [Methanosarcina sp.]|nr:hypothetical protein [Methanosarcina sp.]
MEEKTSKFVLKIFGEYEEDTTIKRDLRDQINCRNRDKSEQAGNIKNG